MKTISVFSEITIKALEDLLMEVYYNRVHKERKIKGYRGCKTYGWIDISSIPCNDPECDSCRMFDRALSEEGKKFKKFDNEKDS